MADRGDASEEVDETIKNPQVVEKYKVAAQVANDALAAIVSACVDGAKVVDLCAKGDKAIQDATKKNKNKEKGVAFPTCVSVNHVVGHFSAEAADTQTIKNGDVVKIDLGVHIDGFITVVAHTHIVGTSAEAPMKGPAADVVCAAHVAAECVLRMLKPGVSNNSITPVIAAIAEAYHVTPVEAVLSHEMAKFIIDGEKIIMNKITEDQKAKDFNVEEGDVYAIDIVMSTGKGQPREGDKKPTIYKRNNDVNYQLKIPASRKVFSEIKSKFPAFPFTIRALEEANSRYGLVEIERHDLVSSYPILYEKEGEFVAQFKFTCLLSGRGALRLTQHSGLPHVFSEYSVSDPTIKDILARPAITSLSNAKKKKKASASSSTSTSTSTSSSTTKSEEKPAEAAAATPSPMETD